MNRITLKNISLASVLLVVLIVIMIAKSRSPFGSKESLFSSSPAEEISRIEFSGSDKKLILEKRNDGWVVNGRHEARKSGINFILQILTEIKIKSPLSPDLFKSEIAEKKITPVKIKVFAGSKLIRSFLVYKTGSNKYGNVMKKRDGAKPFIVYVPGFEGDIGSGFTANELFWEPYTVFNLLPSEIASVSLENFSDESSSFSITNKLNNYTFTGTSGLPEKFDSLQVRRYLSYFAWVPFESWAFDLPESERERIVSTTPTVKVIVKKNAGGEITLLLWEKTNADGITKDSDRLWAKTDERSDLFVMRYFDVDPILKKHSYFLPR